MQLHILEGNTQKLDGGAMFGNAPKALWSRWMKSDDLNRIDMACRSLLMITDDNRKVLFEAGVGVFFEPSLRQRYGIGGEGHQLLKSLSALGLSHTDIDDVILSHAHFDHIGGLFSECKAQQPPKLMFPHARFWLGERQWQHAFNPHARDKASYIPELLAQLKASGRVQLITKKTCDALPFVCFHFSDGHTPGLMLAEIFTKQGPLLFSSDLIPGQFWVHLPICMGYDRFPELLIDEKEALLSYLLDNNGRLFFTHDATMACGLVTLDEKGRFGVETCKLTS